ncbi:MAG: ABC transporter permease [Spirochaeta sp. LUC14_002_19_P3]|nr:MAG: ABC transporter permease [Spirochaeta sp. LUC14_002_19_P3]
MILEIINASLLAATPILLAALGGLYTYHLNVFNIALEGMMLLGAFLGVLGSYLSGTWVIGLIFGALGALGAGAVFAFFAVYLKTDEFVTGIAINMLSLGGSTYALRQMFHVKGAFIHPDIQSLPLWNLPFFGKLPWLSFAALGLTALVWIHLYRTPFGLRLRAAGEDARAADSAGLNTARLKIRALLLSGALCGLSGVFLSLGYVTLFAENMSNGRGWIALAVIILVRGNPLNALLMALFFGFFDGLGLSLQKVNIPSQFTQMLPYLAALAALYFYSRTKRKTL